MEQIIFAGTYALCLVASVFFIIRWLWKPVPMAVVPDGQVTSEAEPTTFITSLEQLYFNGWVQCSVAQDYTCLVVSGSATKEEQYAAWLPLLSQYHTLTGAREAERYAVSVAKIEALNTKLTHAGCLIQALHAGYNETLVQNLRDWGYKKPFTEESLAADLHAVRKALDNDRLKLAVLVKAHADEEKRSRNNHKPVKEDWLKMLHAIEEHKKMVFDRDRLNMLDFALYVNAIKEYNTILTGKNKGYGRK